VVTDRVAGYTDQLHTAEGTVHAIRAAAKVISALPPQHWAAHIAHLNTLIDAAAGLTGLEVLDAALARAGGPHHRHAAARRAPHRTAEIVPQAPGSRPAAPQPPDKAPTWPTYLADSAPTPARTPVAARDTAGGPATQVAADGPTERITAQWAATRWHDVGLALDPRLVAGRDWPRLAVTLELASRTGYNVQEHLPRLAAVEPLPDEQPASALRSRLLREVPQARTTATPQVRRAADRQRIADAAAAHAGNNDPPAATQAQAPLVVARAAEQPRGWAPGVRPLPKPSATSSAGSACHRRRRRGSTSARSRVSVCSPGLSRHPRRRPAALRGEACRCFHGRAIFARRSSTLCSCRPLLTMVLPTPHRSAMSLVASPTSR